MMESNHTLYEVFEEMKKSNKACLYRYKKDSDEYNILSILFTHISEYGIPEETTIDKNGDTYEICHNNKYYYIAQVNKNHLFDYVTERVSEHVTFFDESTIWDFIPDEIKTTEEDLTEQRRKRFEELSRREKEILNNIVKYDDSNRTECPICYETLGDGCYTSEYCGHRFCENCSNQFIENIVEKCPLCRQYLGNFPIIDDDDDDAQSLEECITEEYLEYLCENGLDEQIVKMLGDNFDDYVNHLLEEKGICEVLRCYCEVELPNDNENKYYIYF